MNPRKQCPVLKHTAASNEFSESTRIDGTQFRANLQNGLCFRGKIEPVLGLVIVESLQSEAVVEQGCSTLAAIHHEAVKAPIQPFREFRFVFIPMNQIGG